MSKYTSYLDFKESDIDALNQLPSHWEIKQVRYLLKDGAEGIKIGPFGSALKLEDMVENGFRVYGQENVIKKDFSLGKRQISLKKFLEMDVYKIFTNDILITMMGTSGKCEIVPEGIQEGIIDSHLLRVRVKPKYILPNFFKLLIDESPEIEYQIKTQGKGSIMHGLNSGIVKSLYLPIPPISEQNLILAFLDHETAKIDTLIEKQQQLIGLLKEKRQAVISHAVTKGLNPDAPMKDSGVEWLGEVPAHWECKKLKHIATMKTEKSNNSENVIALENIESWSGKHIKTNSIFDGDGYSFSKNDILFNKLRPYLAKVFLCKTNGIAIGDLLVFEPHKNLNSKFAFYLMISPDFIKEVDSSTYGSKMPRASVDFIKEMPFLLPPAQEQIDIATFIERVTDKFNQLEIKAKNAIELMQERRTALISAAVTGKIDVRNWVVPTTSSDTNEAVQEVSS